MFRMEPNQQNQNRLLPSFSIHLCNAAAMLQSNTGFASKGKVERWNPRRDSPRRYTTRSDRPTTKCMAIEKPSSEMTIINECPVRINVARLRTTTSQWLKVPSIGQNLQSFTGYGDVSTYE